MNEINIVAIEKDNEKYIVVFDDENRRDAYRTLGLWAANPYLSFTWEDAGIVSLKISKLSQIET